MSEARGRIFLILWGEDTLCRACSLRDEGWYVETEGEDGARAFQFIRAEPPDAVVIDLDRRPSHGRELALALRQARATRALPLFFVGGRQAAVEKARAAFPDAAFLSWADLPAALERLAAPGAGEEMVAGTFWEALDRLIASGTVMIDRPAGAPHPRYPDFLYPLDYGYLAGTRAADGGGIDVWVGSQPRREVAGVICTIDLLKRDAEIKILLGCTPEEMQIALEAHNRFGQMAAILVPRTGEPPQQQRRS